MLDDACEEILAHERNGHRRDIFFAVIIAMVAIATVIALRLASDESQKSNGKPTQQQLACEKSLFC